MDIDAYLATPDLPPLMCGQVVGESHVEFVCALLDERKDLKQRLKSLVKAANAVLGNPLRYQHAEALSLLRKAVDEASDALHLEPEETGNQNLKDE